MNAFGLDHKFLLLEILHAFPRSSGRFVCQNRWLIVLSCEEVIDQCWKGHIRGYDRYMLDKKLSACKKSLISWSKDSKSNSRMKIHTLQSQLGTLEEQDYIDPALNHSLLSELDEAYKAEEKFWAQK